MQDKRHRESIKSAKRSGVDHSASKARISNKESSALNRETETQPRTLSREDLWNFRYPSALALSPDNRRLLYRLSRADRSGNCYRSHLRVLDLQTNSSDHVEPTAHRDRPLSSEQIGSAQAWLDSRRILFVADREDRKDHDTDNATGSLRAPESQLYCLPVDGGEAEHWASIPLEIKRFVPLGDEQILVEAQVSREGRALEKAFAIRDSEERETELTRIREERDYHVVEAIPFWSNGDSYTGGSFTQLYLYDRPSGKIEAISPENGDAEIADLERDAEGIPTRLAYFYEERKGVAGLANKLRVLDLASRQLYEIDPDSDFVFSLAAFCEGRLIYAANDGKRYGLNEDGAFYSALLPPLKEHTVPANGLSAAAIHGTCLYPDAFLYNSVGTDVVYGGNRWYKAVRASQNAGEAGLYYLTTAGRDSHVNFLSLDGSVRTITTEEGGVCGLEAGGGVLCINALRGLKAAELYAMDIRSADEEAGKAKPRHEEQLTQHNAWLEAYQLSVPESLHFNASGEEQEGFVLRPHARQADQRNAGGKVAGILTIHGGPKTVYGTVLHHEMQILAAEGYYVFYTNPHGSSGYGRDWADIRGRYGEIDYADLMSFTDAVLQAYPEIDEQRLGVMGGSYGGFMTNWINGHTDRFAAACTQRSISNWESMYGISDIGYYFTADQTGGTPWKERDKLRRQSPLKYAENMHTPTLIIHSDADYRCPLPEGQQLLTALLLNGTPARMVVFKGENHELSRSGKPLHRLRRLREISDWFGCLLTLRG